MSAPPSTGSTAFTTSANDGKRKRRREGGRAGGREGGRMGRDGVGVSVFPQPDLRLLRRVQTTVREEEREGGGEGGRKGGPSNGGPIHWIV